MRSSSDKSVLDINYHPHPRYLYCPLTEEIYFCPVTLIPSGHTFEKDMVDKIIANAADKGGLPLCPLTRQPIEKYVIAWAMKSAVDDHLSQYPEAKKEQYKPVQVEKTLSSAQNDLSSSKTENANTSEENGEKEEKNDDDQIKADEALARKLQSAEIDVERQEKIQLHGMFYTIQTDSNQQRRSVIAKEKEAKQRTDDKEKEKKFDLYGKDEADRKKLMDDLQNLIFALKFEEGPKPRGSINNFSLLFFAMVEQLFLEPLPWQKIVVAEGPKSDGMYFVLKAAIQALRELNPAVLEETKERHACQYDLVQTMLGGQLSLNNSGYASLAKMMGTIKNQPGYLVDQILLRVDCMLHDLCRKHASQLEGRKIPSSLRF